MREDGEDRRRWRGQVRLTRLERALEWAASLAPAPWSFATSCCGMALASAGDPFEPLGSAPPPVSVRSADLLLVAGSITRRQAPMLQALHARMLEPKWVIAWGACAISGGAYDNYATLPGLAQVLPVDVHVTGCPPAPADFRDALARLRRSGGARHDDGWAGSRSALHRPMDRLGADASGEGIDGGPGR